MIFEATPHYNVVVDLLLMSFALFFGSSRKDFNCQDVRVFASLPFSSSSPISKTLFLLVETQENSSLRAHYLPVSTLLSCRSFPQTWMELPWR